MTTAGWLDGPGTVGLVSLIIPTRNRAGLLQKALSSVLQQSYERVEVIVVDNCSQDHTLDVLTKWQAIFDHVRGWNMKILKQEVPGPSACRNLGSNSSSGEFIQYLDDDDILSPDKIATNVSVIRQKNCDVAVGRFMLFWETPRGYWTRNMNPSPFPKQADLPLALLEGWPWGFGASLFTRRALRLAGPWDEGLVRGEDAEWRLRFLRTGCRLEYSPSGLYYYRQMANTQKDVHTKKALANVITAAMKQEDLTLEAIPYEKAARALVIFWGRIASKMYSYGAGELAQLCAKKALRYAPKGRIRHQRLTTRFAYRIGGFKLLGYGHRARASVYRLFCPYRLMGDNAVFRESLPSG